MDFPVSMKVKEPTHGTTHNSANIVLRDKGEFELRDVQTEKKKNNKKSTLKFGGTLKGGETCNISY